MWTSRATVDSVPAKPRGEKAKHGGARRGRGPAAARPAWAAACVLTAAGGLLFEAGSLLALGGLYQVTEIKPHVFAWIPDDVIEEEGDPQSPRAGNAGFVIARDGVAVIDSTNSPFHARELLYEIRQRTEQPVKYVIDTNATPDLFLGNEVFRDLEATIVSTPAVREAVFGHEKSLGEREATDWKLQRRMRGIHITPPEQTFTQAMGLPLQGEHIQVISLNTGEAAGDAAVYLPDERVLFLGDVFENGYFPRLDGRDVRRWIAALRDVEGWNVDVYVPAHGAPGGKKELRDFRQFLEWLSGEIRTRIEEKKSLEQTRQELLPLGNYPWHARELASELVEALYRQLRAAGPSASASGVPMPGFAGNSPPRRLRLAFSSGRETRLDRARETGSSLPVAGAELRAGRNHEAAPPAL